MVQFKILAGGYDVFIATYLFNSLTSSLTLLSKSPCGQNPSWISLNPVNSSLLYATNENAPGALQSFGINRDGTLSPPIDTVPSGGDLPAFTTALSTGDVAVMNYNTGNGRIFPTIRGSRQSKFDPDSPTITFPPPSDGVSHPHMALEYRGEVFVPDLGGDTIWRLKKDLWSSSYQIQGSIPQPKGSGPRHIAIHDNRLFTIHELSSTLSVQTIPFQPNGTSTTFASVSIIPSNSPAGAQWAAAEILIPPTTPRFPIPYIYVSNRNTANNSPQGDSIAIFEHVNKGQRNEGLKLIKQVFTGLNQIRGMEFGNVQQGGDEFLVASGVADHIFSRLIMVQFKFLAGGYDFFIATYVFNSATSSLTLTSKSPSGQNPSWISLNPTNHSLLYAVNENWYGSLQSFGINQSGSLSPAIDTVYSGGDVPAFAVALSTGSVAVMNYQSGTGRIVPTISGSSSSKFDPNSPIITFPQPSGGVSHPHMALEYQGEILVPDLGGDTIWRLKQASGSTSYQIQGSIPQPKGSGPRHIAIYNDRLFTIHELSSTLSVQTIPAQPSGSSTTFATVSIIPSNPPSGATWAAAEILIPPPTSRFPTPYIYVSNRNTANNSPQGDSIAIFEHINKGQSNEGLRLVNQVFTGLNQIRGMEFGNADQGGEEFLAASGVAGSGGVVVFRRTDGGRNLEIVARNTDVLTRTSFVWL
ncbi:hypothetical protein CVT24_006979 [Panaeolus cyanescens]|uniref:Isomerase YbhE n=1 Tax=Panaeolus cyanescens TaxID=181874 RepID=A0A409W5G2_9AGAR|nr:hypothetical protein CVT24_006979 [Panaeolus cyanescens]